MLNNHYALKEYKTITRMQLISKARNLGERCFSCIHNGRKSSKRLEKYFPSFKSLDMLEPVIKSKDNCPLCGYFVVGILDEKPLRLFEYCLRDGCKFKQKTEVVNVKQ